jgi:hypothetical protein
MSSTIEGGCLCGEVRYCVTGAPRAASLCHCRTCRRACGAPVAAWIMIQREQLVIERGAPVTFRSSPEVERSFCGRCGTPLTYGHDDSPASIDVLTATLDEPAAFPPDREIWLDHRIGWMATNDQLRPYPRSSREM